MDETVTSDAPNDGAMMDAADWQARAGHIRQVLAAAPDTAVAEALGTFLFADDGGKTWTFNGAVWMSWDGALWSEGAAPDNLRLQPFLHEADAAEAVETSPAAADTSTAVETETPSMSTDTTSMAAEMPAASLPDEKAADEKPSDSTSMAAETTATAVPELPAKADSYPMAELSSADAKPTELAADKADASWTSTSPSVTDKPSDSAATTEDLTPKSEFAARMSQTPTSTEPAAATPSSSMGASTPASASAGSDSAGSTAAPAMGAAAAAAATPAAFKATHAVPPAGMGAWTRPDPSVRPEYQLAPRTELMVTEMLSSGWAHVAGSNGWTGWVDGRQLVSMQPAAVVTPAPAMSQPATQWQPAQPAAQPATQWQPAQPAAQPATQWQPSQPAAQPAAQPATQWQPAQPAAQPAAQPTPTWQPAPQPAQPMPQTAPAAQPAAAAQPGAAFRPTHAVPPMGMPAWAQPNPALPPTAQLQGGLQVMVGEWSQSGWARVVASNGWSAWVDGRMLVPFEQAPYQR
jgi:hypothetical protein